MPSACSGSIFGNGQMLVMGTIEDPTNPVCELVSTQRIAVRLDHFSLAVYPLGFYGVQPRTLLGKKADDDPHPFCAVPDFWVVRSDLALDSRIGGPYDATERQREQQCCQRHNQRSRHGQQPPWPRSPLRCLPYVG